MKKIFKIINKYIRSGINILVRLLLAVVYLFFIFPFAVWIRLFTDYLETKVKSPYWIPCGNIKNEKELLTRQ